MDTTLVELKEPKYKFELSPSRTSFAIKNPYRHDVVITLDGEYFKIDDELTCYGILDRHRLINDVASIFYLIYHQGRFVSKKGKANYKLAEWARKRTGMALAKRMAENCRILLEKIDPQVMAFEKRVFSIFGKTFSTVCSEIYSKPSELRKKIFSNEYYLKDFFKFRAAVMYLKKIEDAYGQIGKLEEWYKTFLGDSSNKAKNQTLYNLPGGIPIGLMIKDFKDMVIDHQLKSRLEVLCNLYTVVCQRNDAHYNVIHHSTEDQLKRGLNLIKARIDEEGNLRKANKVFNLLRYALDYPEPHNGNFVGLANKSIEWHRTAYRDTATRRNSKYKMEQETKKPPVELPKNQYIKFLSTVGEIIDEGENMRHCIGSYASYAVNEDCYLFHCEYKNTKASIEVSSNGYVSQSRGPNNKENAASKYAKRVLGQWASKFADNTERVKLYPVDEEAIIEEEDVLAF